MTAAALAGTLAWVVLVAHGIYTRDPWEVATVLVIGWAWRAPEVRP